jgi:hypothetical protein
VRGNTRGCICHLERRAAGPLRVVSRVAALWGAVHVFFLVGVRNRLSVMLGWIWSYFTFDVGVRLITQAGAGQSAPIYPGRA